MINYYRKFIPGIAELTQPLTEILRKGIRFHLGPEQLTSIQKCRDILTTRPLLAFPDFRRKFKVTTDASEIAVGAVLSQNFETGEKPIAYAGRKLNDAERRYSAIERELLAVVWAVEHFRPYIYGRQFELLTDHKPLLSLGTLRESSARVSRWKERLAAYNFHIVHKKGVDNAVADWLSRDLVVNAIEKEDTPVEPFAVRYLREWAESGPEIPTTQRENEGHTTPSRRPQELSDIEEILRTPANRADTEAISREVEENASPTNRPQELPEIDEIINDKKLQIIIKSRQNPGTETSASVYEGLSAIIVRTQATTDDVELERIFTEFSQSGRTCYIYVGNRLIMDKLRRLWRQGKIGS